jgi:uncharacterized membrane protein
MKYKILLLLFAIIIVISSILSFIPLDKVCKSETSSCEIVNTSQYEKILGIPNSYLGLGAYLFLFALTLSQMRRPKETKRKILALGLIIGTGFAIYFLVIQFLVLKAVCNYCLIADSATILSLIIFFGIKKEY